MKKLVKDADGIYTLHNGQHVAVCPFQSKVPIEVDTPITGIGRRAVHFASTPCTSQCALFSFIEKGSTLTLECSPTLSIERIEVEETKPEQSKLKLT